MDFPQPLVRGRLVQREACNAFAACHDLDPKFAVALEAAADAGVEVLVYACEMGQSAIRIDRSLAWRR